MVVSDSEEGETEMLTLRVSPALVERLEKVAKRLRRTRSWVAREAIVHGLPKVEAEVGA